MDNKYKVKLVDEATYLHEVTYQDGNSHFYRMYKGHKFGNTQMVPDVPKRMEEIANFQVRNDDIVVAMCPKSGTHWICNIVSMLARNNTEYIGTPPIIEYANLEELSQMESPRILITHLPFEFFPTGLKEGKCKIVSVSRNPKDVITSYHSFWKSLGKVAFQSTFSTFLNLYLSRQIFGDSWFDHMKMWSPALKQFPDMKVLFLNFENMKKELYQNVVRVAEFLDCGQNEEFFRQIEGKCSFENMKQNANKGQKSQEEFETMIEGGILPIYRKGEVGDWKNWFTVAESEMFDKIYADELKGHDISFVYQPDQEV